MLEGSASETLGMVVSEDVHDAAVEDDRSRFTAGETTFRISISSPSCTD